MAETRTYVAALRVCWLGYADQSRGPARRLLLLPYTTTTRRQHQQQFLRHPNSTYLAAESFSEAGNVLGGRWLVLPPRSGRRVIVSDPGQPLMTGSVHPVPAPRLLLLTMWCTVVLCGAVWRRVVLSGAVWCTVVQCGAVWCYVAPCGAVWCRNQRYCVGDCLLLCPCVCSGICKLFYRN